VASLIHCSKAGLVLQDQVVPALEQDETGPWESPWRAPGRGRNGSVDPPGVEDQGRGLDLGQAVADIDHREGLHEPAAPSGEVERRSNSLNHSIWAGVPSGMKVWVNICR
jgi:hypothetical protein